MNIGVQKTLKLSAKFKLENDISESRSINLGWLH